MIKKVKIRPKIYPKFNFYDIMDLK